MTTPTPIELSDLTDVTLNGNGVADQLMQMAVLHMDEEFRKGRITGADRASVYLGSLTAVMAQSVQFLLQKDQASYQALLLANQADLVELEKQKVALELITVEKQNQKIDKEIQVMGEQLLLIKQQVITERANTENITTGIVGKTQTKLTSENTNIVKTGSKIDAEKLLIDQNKANAVVQGAVYTNQASKINSEDALLIQKKITERAQTENVAADSSVVGKQIALYAAQVEGFTQDSRQKAAKVALDAFAVMATNEDYPASLTPDALKDSRTTRVFEKLFAGIGA